jgi:hypothetical protein
MDMSSRSGEGYAHPRPTKTCFEAAERAASLVLRRYAQAWRVPSGDIAGPNFDTGSIYGCRMRNVGGSVMYQMLRLTIAAMAVVLASFSTSAPAQVAVTQIKVTEKHIEGFIAAQKDMSAVVEKMMQGAVFSNGANAKYEAELKAVTKKHGFKNFAEYEAVAASISLVMAAIDPQTKVFTDQHTAIKKELEDASVEKSIPDSEKKKLRRSLNLALRAVRPIQFPSNIELVQKYYDKIDVTTIAAYDGDSWRNSSVARAISE